MGSRRSLRVVGLAAACAVLVLAGLARANGGDSVAAAPEVPLGKEQHGDREAGTKSSIDYWRVTLVRGDLLLVDFRPTTQDGHTVFVWVFDPGVSDFGVGQDDPSAAAGTKTKARLRFRATEDGRWTLGFFNGCFTCLEFPLHYAFTAYVQAFTRLALTGPSLARPGQRMTFHGKVSGRGVAGGKVVVQRQRGRAWAAIAVRAVDRAGSFVVATRAGAPGTYRLRALYRGDASHQPSSASLVYRVA